MPVRKKKGATGPSCITITKVKNGGKRQPSFVLIEIDATGELSKVCKALAAEVGTHAKHGKGNVILALVRLDEALQDAVPRSLITQIAKNFPRSVQIAAGTPSMGGVACCHH